MLIAFALTSLLLTIGPPTARQATAGAQPDDCEAWQDCRDRALAAAARKDLERFHDLAWRAVQKGPRNDPALMTMLARAQSLSGRPGDALVMLERLLAMGVAVDDTAESEDFRRVRALPAWTGFHVRLSAVESSVPFTPVDPDTVPAVGAIPSPGVPAIETRKSDAPSAGRPEAAGAESGAPTAAAGDALRFTTIPFEPAGLAYDAVSNRFILGNRRERKLTVIGEGSQRMANLAGEVSAGFGEIEAIALDARRGDLWVASTPDGGAPPKLHKLQLISGRLLLTASPAETAAHARITDIALTRQGAVLALDSAGGRILQLDEAERELDTVATLGIPGLASIAPAPGGIVYVAGADGVARVEASRRRSSALAAPDDSALTEYVWIRWHRDALIGVQKSSGGLFRIVRLHLDGQGRRIVRVDVLESDVAMVDPSSLAIRDDELFYLGRQTGYSATGGMDVTIRRVALR